MNRTDWLLEQGGLETPLSREVFPKENPRNCLRNFLSRSANIVQRGEFRFQLGTMAVAENKVLWHPLFEDFARYYGFTPRACQPYRARTKGKVESGVKYVKRNALAGRRFTSWEELNDWLERWSAEVADPRIHGTTHERPIDRFAHEQLTPIVICRCLSARCEQTFRSLTQLRRLRRNANYRCCRQIQRRSGHHLGFARRSIATSKAATMTTGISTHASSRSDSPGTKAARPPSRRRYKMTNAKSAPSARTKAVPTT